MSLRLLGFPPRGPVALHPDAHGLPLGRGHRPTLRSGLRRTRPGRTTALPSDRTQGLLKRRNLSIELCALRLQFRQGCPKGLSNVGHDSSFSVVVLPAQGMLL